MPLDFPLDPFEQAVRADPDIVGVLYTASLGRGPTDRYSDLDIEVWLIMDSDTCCLG